MVIICPYCDIEISEKLVEAEDGCCPECGTSITARNVIEEPEEDIYAKEFEDEFDMDDDELLSDPYEDVEFQKPRRLNREWDEMQEEPAEDVLAIAAGVKTASSRMKEKEVQEDAAVCSEPEEKKKSSSKAAKKETKSSAKKEPKKVAKAAKTARKK